MGASGTLEIACPSHPEVIMKKGCGCAKVLKKATCPSWRVFAGGVWLQHERISTE